MSKEKCLILVAFMVGSINTQTLIADECTTPKNESGVCIDLMSCPILLKTLQHRVETKSVEDFDYLKKSHCGFAGRSPKVCCPLAEISPDESDLDGVVSESKDPSVDVKVGLLSPPGCGKIAVNRDKIVGGNKAELGYWPWIAALGYQHVNRRGVLADGPLQWLCAGSLITDRHVLTAAHCVNHNRINSKLVAVRLGELDLNPNVTDGANPMDVYIESSVVHQAYNALAYTTDIAILKLNRSVTYNQFIQPICLLSKSEMNSINIAKVMPYVAGWGSVNPFQQDDRIFAPDTALMEVQVPIVNNTVCKRNYANRMSVIDDRVICAGYPKGGKDSCRGDSGGPLMWPKNKQFFLIGVVSYGNVVCGKPNSPGVYTKVSNYIDWIDNNLK